MMVVVVAVLIIVFVESAIIQCAGIKAVVVARCAGIKAVNIAVVVLSCLSVKSVEIYHFSLPLFYVFCCSLLNCLNYSTPVRECQAFFEKIFSSFCTKRLFGFALAL